MNIATNLAWVVIGLLNMGLGYLIGTYAAWPLGGAFIGIIGILLTADGVKHLLPKRGVKFNHYG